MRIAKETPYTTLFLVSLYSLILH